MKLLTLWRIYIRVTPCNPWYNLVITIVNFDIPIPIASDKLHKVFHSKAKASFIYQDLGSGDKSLHQWRISILIKYEGVVLHSITLVYLSTSNCQRLGVLLKHFPILANYLRVKETVQIIEIPLVYDVCCVGVTTVTEHIFNRKPRISFLQEKHLYNK